MDGKDDKLEQYARKTTRQKYAKNDAYADFRQAVFVSDLQDSWSYEQLTHLMGTYRKFKIRTLQCLQSQSL